MLGITHDIDSYLGRLQEELARIERGQVQRLADLLYDAWQEDRAVFLFGNGGSGATASHACEDLSKNALRDARDQNQRRPRILSLTDNTSWITAVSNDLGFEQVFVQQLMHLAQAGDVAIAISGSGNSPNVLLAVDWANRAGLRTFGLTGFDGGKLKRLQQDGLHLDLHDMGMVESIHHAIFHWIVDDLHARVNGLERR